jgi:hypothetical protein
MFVFKRASKNLKVLGVINTLILLVLVSFSHLIPPACFILGMAIHMVFWLGCIIMIAGTPGKGTSQMLLPLPTLATRTFQIVQHWLLPILQLVGFWTAIYWIKFPLLQIILSLFQGGIGFIFLTNFRAYLNKSQMLELRSHYIYDLLTLITVFYANFAVFSTGAYEGIPHILIILGSLLLILVIFIADGLRFLPEQRVSLTIAALVLLLFIYAAFALDLISPFKTVIFLTLLSYLLLNLTHHWIAAEHNRVVIWLEYLLIIAITVIIVLQIHV